MFARLERGVLGLRPCRNARVQRGEALVHLEAMKMVNAIRAPEDAVVAEVLVDEGQRVAREYGCNGPLGIKRSVFILDRDGVVRYRHVAALVGVTLLAGQMLWTLVRAHFATSR